MDKYNWAKLWWSMSNKKKKKKERIRWRRGEDALVKINQ